MADPKPKNSSSIRALSIPGDVRDALQSEAKTRGMSVSALSREIMGEYLAGTLQVPSTPGPRLISTSMWIPVDLWTKFTRKSEKQQHSVQWIFRTWLDREQKAA
jgi:hypothetical protein